MSMVGDIGFGVPEVSSLKDKMLAVQQALPPNEVPNSLRVFVMREPFDDFFHLITDNGHSDELEDADARAWLKARGADEELIQKTITQAWNFYRAVCLILNPKYPQEDLSPLAPKLTPL